ncbi:MAG: (2Fe-2S)-binding protein [Oscillospiraceae bacterium]|nr:(2Fe-2S)-binding protein [Oscillospiraceae bacterium]
MKQILAFNLNGIPVEVAVKPEWTLLELLRDEIGLTSPKCGCNRGDCGACTVHLDGEAVKSCCVLAMTVAGKSVVTLDGITPAEGLHPVQQAFYDNGSPQCGYCTPGMVMAAVAFLKKNPKPTMAELKEALSGNICRCGSYEKYAQAVMAVANGEYGPLPEGSVE